MVDARVRDYAVERDYTRYTSTLEEAWRISIVGLTDAITSALAISEEPWELGPDDSFISDPMAALNLVAGWTTLYPISKLLKPKA